jgi:hypothetical protein
MTDGIDKQKMFLALDCFTKYICPGRPDIRITSAIFAEARSQSAQYLKSIRKGNATRPAGTYRHTDATKSKQSASALGLVKRPAGFTHPEETINKMCANRKGKGLGNIPWNKGLVQVCPHCSKVVKGTLNRWHGDRCKFKPA